MDKIYAVTVTGPYAENNEKYDLFLVKSNAGEMTKLCTKMGRYNASNRHDFYNYELINPIYNNKDGEIYKFFVSKTSKNYNIDGYTNTGYIICTEDEKERYKNLYESLNSGKVVNFEKAKVLTIDEAYEEFNNIMAKFKSNNRIFKDSNSDEYVL